MKLRGSKGLFTIVDEEDYKTFNLGLYKCSPGVCNNTIYARIWYNGKKLFLHRLIMGLLNGSSSIFVDHIDHDGLNNSRSNLRITNRTGNARNSVKKNIKKSASVYKGVRRTKNKIYRWQSAIRASGKHKHLGVYKTEEEAAEAYNKAAIEYFGDMAFLNVIK